MAGKTKTPAAAAAPAQPQEATQPALEQPRAGGSYIRHPDGSLERKEHTADAHITQPAADAPVEQE